MQSPPAGRGFTLVELLVVIAIIGVLASITLPAVMQARSSSRKTHCGNNVRQIGLALHAWHDTNQQFPAGNDGYHECHHAWSTMILPTLELSTLFDEYDMNAAWNAASPSKNSRVVGADVGVYKCPEAPRHFSGRTDYGGNTGTALCSLPSGSSVGQCWEAGVLVPVGSTVDEKARQAPVSLADISDGAGNTFMLLEDAGRPAAIGGAWGNGFNILGHDTGPINQTPVNEIYSFHSGGAHVGMADGSARFLAENTHPDVIASLSTRANGELDQLGSTR